MNAPPYTLTNESITVIWNGKTHTVQKGATNFQALRNAILHESWDTIPNFLTAAKALTDWAKGKFTIQGDRFLYEGKEIPSEINGRIVAMATAGEDPEPVFKFWERLQKNPSFRSVKQLWGFLQHQGIPLTPDGCFLAYKSVRQDYKDHHSGKFENKPGVTQEMPRNQISDDPDLACHEGFHVGALEYARTFNSSGRMIVCKIDPQDVVCVPKDESQRKMRVCKYVVLGNHNGSHLPSTTYIPDENDARNVDNPADEEEEDPDNDPLAPVEEEEEEETESEEDDFTITEDVDMSDLETEEAPKVEKAKKEKPKKEYKAPAAMKKFEPMGMEDLMKQSIEDLRQYAGKGLQIVGASKIPGGKSALVSKILEVRG